MMMVLILMHPQRSSIPVGMVDLTLPGKDERQNDHPTKRYLSAEVVITRIDGPATGFLVEFARQLEPGFVYIT